MDEDTKSLYDKNTWDLMKKKGPLVQGWVVVNGFSKRKKV